MSDTPLVSDHLYSPMGPEYKYCSYPVFEDDPATGLFGLGGPMECGLSREEHSGSRDV